MRRNYKIALASLYLLLSVVCWSWQAACLVYAVLHGHEYSWWDVGTVVAPVLTVLLVTLIVTCLPAPQPRDEST